jgi:hypothetical protein
MGSGFSKSKATTKSPSGHPTNDFELAVRCSKELEYFLETYFRSTGQGLHEKVATAQPALPLSLSKRLHFIGSCRNQIVHVHGVDRLDNREAFIAAFDLSWKELQDLVSIYYSIPKAA